MLIVIMTIVVVAEVCGGGSCGANGNMGSGGRGGICPPYLESLCRGPMADGFVIETRGLVDILF